MALSNLSLSMGTENFVKKSLWIYEYILVYAGVQVAHIHSQFFYTANEIVGTISITTTKSKNLTMKWIVDCRLVAQNSAVVLVGISP